MSLMTRSRSALAAAAALRAAVTPASVTISVGTGSALPFEMRLGEASITASAGEFAVRDYANEPARYVQARSDGIAVRWIGA